MSDAFLSAGAFDLKIDKTGLPFRIIEKTASLRSRLTRIPYGDQAVFVRQSFFDRIGGFSPIPIMEDVELMRRVKQAGGRIGFVDRPVSTSARRWEKEGLLRCTFRNWLMMTLYLFGVPPERLVPLYRNHTEVKAEVRRQKAENRKQKDEGDA